jgi:predicted AAA+ superfamily ATPase
MMINRILQSQIFESLQHFPAVGLVGPRQAGKTTLALLIAKQWPQKTLYLDLENPLDYDNLSNPAIFLPRHSDTLVIIDEVQLRPELFPVLRSLIDADRHPGRFLLLGSSSPDLIRQSGQSLAGRIAYHELCPFVLNELSPEQMDTLWLRGGFPESILAPTEKVSIQWRDNFIMTYLQRDLSVMGYGMRLPSMTLRRLWTMLAHTHGQLTNQSQLSVNMELSRQSIRKYVDILQETFMIRQLGPYYVNTKKRLIKSPKIFIRDSGILHALLGIKSMQDLMNHSILGFSWEGFCMEQILGQIPGTWESYFYRTKVGAEVDLVLQRRVGEAPIFVEFKYSQSPKLTKGFWVARDDLKPSACYVVYPGPRAYPLADHVEVLPLSQIHEIWKE